MITTLAPLGATHTIVLSLAYGDVPTIPPVNDTAETQSAVVPHQTVTVTAYLKPKDGAKGEPKTLQFEGPVADVQAKLESDLPLAVSKIQQHLSTLDQLDAQLAAEKEKAAKEAESKKESPGKAAPAPAGVKSRTVYPSTSKKPDVKPSKSPGMKKASEIINKPTGAAAEALAKVKAAAEKGKAAAEATATSPAEPAAEPAPEPEAPASLESLAAALPASDEAVDL